MKKRQRRVQPQIRETPPQPEVSYSLEDILDEFGGWSRPAASAVPAAPEEPQPEPVPDVPAAEEAPEPAARPPVQNAEPEDSPRPERRSRIKIIPFEQSVPLSGKTRPSHNAPPQFQAAPPPPPPERRAEPEPVNWKGLYKSACKQAKRLSIRLRLCSLWTLLGVALTVLCHWEVKLGGFALPLIPTGRLLIGLMIAGALTAYDVMVNGIYQLFRLRPDLDTLLCFCAVVFTIDGFARLGDGARLPYAAVLLLGVWFALWGRALANRARIRNLKVLQALPDKPMAAVLSHRAWGNRDCVFRSEGDRGLFLDDLESASLVDRVMGIYSPSVMILSLLLAILMAILQKRNFLMSWSLMLAGALPLAAFVTWWKPFAALSRRIGRGGAALCGWRGVRELAAPCCLAVTDGDLFPKGSVTLNGIKLFGGRAIAQLAGYADAIMEKSGSGLAPVFREIFVNQNGFPCTIDAFRRYEGGGFGAEIGGDVVLLGTIAFMRAMGVHMEAGTNVRQAVYCAVNGELAAVFALKYNASPSVHTGLRTALRSRRLTLLLATRDFILTPDMVRRKYKIPSDSLEYPSVEERARLSGPYAAVGGVQTALLARNSFFILSETVAGARALYGGVRSALAVNLLGGGFGLAFAAFLAWTGGFALASAANLMIFCFVWTLPALVLNVSSTR